MPRELRTFAEKKLSKDFLNPLTVGHKITNRPFFDLIETEALTNNGKYQEKHRNEVL